MFVSVYAAMEKRGRKTAKESEDALLFQAYVRSFQAVDQKARRAVVRQLIALKELCRSARVFVVTEDELRELESLRLEVKRLRVAVMELEDKAKGCTNARG